MQKTILIGRVGRDATVQQLQSTSVINFSLCHSEKFTNKEGVKVEKSQWWECSYFVDKTTIAQYILKGGEIYVEGNADCRLYQPANGEPQAQLTLRVHSIQLLGSPNNENSRKVSTELSGHYAEQPLRGSTGGTDIAKDNLNF